MASLELGSAAPDFTLDDCDGNTVSLSDLEGKKVLLYFFTSPGGGNRTRMALGYRENAERFTDKNLVVYGINDKDAESAREWIEKEQLPFSILLDHDRRVGIAYGMSDALAERYVANNAEGRRPAVVINESGLIAAWEPDMNTVDQINSLIARL